MSRYEMCHVCGHRMRRKKSLWGSWDGETYICDYCNGNDSEDAEEDEGLSVSDAALIWASNGKDEDYTFGYSEDELEDALN
jgi:hypothetical protein